MFWSNFKRLFMKGLAALLPTVVTIAMLLWAFNWINGHIASPITDYIITFLPDPEAELPSFFTNTFKFDAENDPLKYGERLNRLDPNSGAQLTREYLTIHHPACESNDDEIAIPARRRRAEALWHIVFAKWRLNVVGFLIAIALVWVVGYFLSGLIGRTILRMGESLVLRIPFIRSLYPNIKQVTDFLFGDKQIEFGGVVAVEYPRKGIWSVGLLTGPAMKTIADHAAQDDLVTIFIPSSPTPITGYTITVTRKDIIELALSIDEALRFTISGGVIKPPAEGGKPEMAMSDFFGDSKLLEKPPPEP